MILMLIELAIIHVTETTLCWDCGRADFGAWGELAIGACDPYLMGDGALLLSGGTNPGA